MLIIRNLSIREPVSQQYLVKKMTLSLPKGETLGLVGESGSGKTLTIHAIAGLLSHQVRCEYDHISWCGESYLDQNLDRQNSYRGGKIAVVFQEPMTALNPLHCVGDQIAEMILAHRKVTSIEQEIADLMRLVELDHIQNIGRRYPHELSGGQRQRILIAMAVANKPELLIADEPTTALDGALKMQIMSLLSRLKAALNMSMIVVTHDLKSISGIADSMVVMRRGAIVDQGQYHDMVQAPKVYYTRKLLSPRTCRPNKRVQDQTVLEVASLSVRRDSNSLFSFIQKRAPILSNISFHINAGECVGVVGSSGAGKTTLAKSLLRMCHATGSIKCLNHDWLTMPRQTLRKERCRMQMIAQDPFSSLSPRMRVDDIVKEGLQVNPWLVEGCIEDAVESAIKSVGLNQKIRNHYPHELSGGQRQRVAIARAIILRPDILILDEPTASLDRVVADRILSLLSKLQRQYHMAYLLISHDWSVVEALSHRVLVLDHGRIIEQGTVDHLKHHAQQGLTQAIVTQ